MNVKIINKYKKKSVPELIKIAQNWCNKYIRLRDKEKGCVSCDIYSIEDASHFYSGGHYPELRFNEDNIHGSCAKCNRFLHGNLNEYRRRIDQRIGVEGLKMLDLIADQSKRNNHKWDRLALIETIINYQTKFKEL